MKKKVGGKEYEIKDLNLQERCDLNDRLIKTGDQVSFTMWVDVIKMATDLSDDQINELGTPEIISLATACIDSVNKKKDKK